jgi:hypothetical protein
MITAKEAAQIAGPTIEELCEFFDPFIRGAAKKGNRTVAVFHGKLENEAYKNTDRWKSFVDQMKKYGYSVQLYYQECSIAVDMRILISW